MLKLTYTENSFNLEYLNESWENWVNTRVILALHSGTNIRLESSTASFLIPTDFPYLAALEEVDQENRVEICQCDAEFVEVTLKGIWLTSDAESDVGVFVTSLSEYAEFLLHEFSHQQFCHV